MFESVVNSKDDVDLREKAQRFRYEILQPGGTIDERTMVRNLVGGDCNMDAFCRRFNIFSGANIGLLSTARQ
jgi:hypothetical protein